MTTPHSAPYTDPTRDNLASLPVALTPRCQWVLWRGVDRQQASGTVKLNKIPINPTTLTHADSTDPTTWGTFQQCVDALPLALEAWETDDPSAYRGGGIGYVFSELDPYVVIDLDHCVDPVTGVIVAGAQGHVDRLASYT